MAEVNEKYLKPIRDICQKIIVNENVKKLVADLREYSEKGAFYEFHVFFELLEVLSQNSELSKPKTGEIFKLLNELLRNGNNKESIISRLYNFIINHKVMAGNWLFGLFNLNIYLNRIVRISQMS